MSSMKKNQRFSLNLIAENIGPGLGLEYEYLFSDKIEAIVGLATNQAKLRGQTQADGTETIQFSTQSLHTFLAYRSSSWIYPSAGLTLRLSSGQYGWNGPNLFGNFRANLMTADVRISSEWVFKERYILGVHWLGVGAPIFGTFAVESTDELEDFTKFYTSVAPKSRIFQELKSQILLCYANIHFGIVF